MKRELFYFGLFVVLALVFMYALNVKMERMEKNRDYIEQCGMEAYIYKTVFRMVIILIIIIFILIVNKLLYMK
jgi:hypothetical protein